MTLTFATAAVVILLVLYLAVQFGQTLAASLTFVP